MNEHREALRLILTTPLRKSQLIHFAKLSINTIDRYREISWDQNTSLKKSIVAGDWTITHPENHWMRQSRGLKKMQYRTQER